MEAYIVAGYRSAVGKAKRGGFKNYRTDDLAVDVIKHLTSQVPELDTTKVDDVIVGCANPEGEQGLQIARLTSARALGKEVPGVTINRYCASGLEAISMAVSKIRAGFGDIFVLLENPLSLRTFFISIRFKPEYSRCIHDSRYFVDDRDSKR